jgi:hypothetical protein
MTADKYMEFIPMIWFTCNYKNSQMLFYKTMWEMVLLSLFNFQVDEYMESVVQLLISSSRELPVVPLEGVSRIHNSPTDPTVFVGSPGCRYCHRDRVRTLKMQATFSSHSRIWLSHLADTQVPNEIYLEGHDSDLSQAPRSEFVSPNISFAPWDAFSPLPTHLAGT